MTINISSLSVVFPAYNEQDNIVDSIAKAEHVLNKLNLDYEIIVVNDGSSDSTRDIVEEICRRNERLHIINHETNLGYGAAVWSGISCLSKEYLFFTDSDLQFDLNEINRLLPHVPEYDAVIGYRIKRKDPFMRLINAWGWNLLNRLLFGLKVRDIDCAFKLFKRKIFDHIYVKSRGAMMSAEMLTRIYRAGYKVLEVGVNHYPRKAGSPTGAKLTVILRAFWELLLTYRGDLGDQNIKQLTKFGCVGIINTVVDWAIYFVLISTIMNIYPVLSKSISYFFGIINSYYFNRYWTFHSDGKIYVEFPKFVASNLASLFINSAIMSICLKYLNTSTLIGLIWSTIGAFLFNFIISKRYIFKRIRDRNFVQNIGG